MEFRDRRPKISLKEGRRIWPGIIETFVLVPSTILLSFPLMLREPVSLSYGFAGFLFLMTLFKPKLGILQFFLITFLIPFFYSLFKIDPPDSTNTGITYDGLLNLFFVIGVSASAFMHKPFGTIKNVISVTPGLTFFFLFILISVLETPMHWSSLVSLKELTKYTATLLFFFGLSLFFTLKDLSLLKNMIIITIVLLLTYTVITFQAGSSEVITRGSLSMTRFTPDVLSAVDLSVLIILFFPFSILNVYNNPNILSKIIWIIIGIGIVSGSLIYGARTSIVALLLSLLIYLRSRIIQVAFVVTFVIAFMFFQDLILKFTSGITDWYASDNTISSRVDELWLPVLKSNFSNFILGIGSRGFGDYLYKITGVYFTAAHNIFLVILVELGIFAFAAWIMANFKLITGSMRNKPYYYIINLQPLVIFLIAGFTSTVNFNLFYRVIFLFLALNHLQYFEEMRKNKLQ